MIQEGCNGWTAEGGSGRGGVRDDGGCGLQAQEPPRADGWVVLPVDEYRALRSARFQPRRIRRRRQLTPR